MDNFGRLNGKRWKVIEYADKNNIRIQCKKCNREIIQKASIISSHSINCTECTRRDKERKSLVNDLVNEIRAKRKELDILEERLHKEYEKRVKREERRQRQRLKKREKNKINELNRQNRIKDNGEIDRDIVLETLYKRDKGICSICGRVCDYNDFKITEKGHFVAGRMYPSIDHIFPLSKGGTHTWKNVQLAHFSCNSRKGGRILNPAHVG